MKGAFTAARTFDRENEIGSINVGKDATFTLLEQNPFNIVPEKRKKTPIIGVVHQGKIR